MLKRFVINAYEKRLQKHIKDKYSKKGVLIKVFDSNKKRSESLVEILKESDNFNTLNSSKKQENLKNETKSEEEFLSKFRNVVKGGPKHSIAVNRAHHLTNFLSEYIINAFQSSHFDSPEIPDELNQEFDLNGFKKEKFYFEISNVQLMPDLSAIKISWFSSDNEEINKIVEEFLEKKLKCQIRATLSSERVMNYVPRIAFLRDNSKVLMSKLDDHLMKINLEHRNEKEHDEQEVINQQEIREESPVQETKQNRIVNNVYGVDFDSLVNTIKQGGSSDLKVWKQEESIENNNLISLESQKPANFEASLKAFEINKRIRRERLNKSVLNKLAHIEFEMLKEKNFQ
ncbi:unnamed protein product [Brachionus calyciflorus]|uniref:Uncharacterized protein n=1 Tax=Brachionus calyciflorus TaxID=104777 RepID=A0A814HJ89_9BILA|nr:unnamed protein product [Brachionus calyciflorus]